jgi:hypothetical protein
MAGNVSEWVMDVYRPLTPDDEFEFRPFRGNQYQTQVKDQDGIVIQDSLKYAFNGVDSDIVSIPGQVKWRDVDKNHKEDNLAERRNYHESDERSYQDGDVASSIYLLCTKQVLQHLSATRLTFIKVVHGKTVHSG